MTKAQWVLVISGGFIVGGLGTLLVQADKYSAVIEKFPLSISSSSVPQDKITFLEDIHDTKFFAEYREVLKFSPDDTVYVYGQRIGKYKGFYKDMGISVKAAGCKQLRVEGRLRIMGISIKAAGYTQMHIYLVPIEGLEQVPETHFYVKFKQDYSHILSFEVWRVVAWGADEQVGTVYFGTDAMNQSSEPTEPFRFLYGNIRWDGCMNWIFDEEGVMAHHCGIDGVEEFTKLLVWLAEQGKRLDTWDENLGGRDPLVIHTGFVD